MKKSEVEIGKTYIVKVSGKLVPVQIINESPFGGWNGGNLLTKRGVRIRTAARLRSEVKPAEEITKFLEREYARTEID